ncbi:MAG: hypothetical protein WCD11_17560 [Solirubrobacteraceae bacterium]
MADDPGRSPELDPFRAESTQNPKDPAGSASDPKDPTGSTSGPNDPTPPQTGAADWPGEDRLDIQLFVGQLHGLLDEVIRLPLSGLSEEERASLESAYREASFRFGRLQARLNTGEYDGEFDDHGLSGRQLSHKLHRWTQGLARFLKSRRGQTALTALRAAQVLLGSLAAFVGVAEPIRELTDTFVETISDVASSEPSPPQASTRRRRTTGQ